MQLHFCLSVCESLPPSTSQIQILTSLDKDEEPGT